MEGGVLPRIKEMLHRIGDKKPKYYAVMDLTSGYHQAPWQQRAGPIPRLSPAWDSSNGRGYQWVLKGPRVFPDDYDHDCTRRVDLEYPGSIFR